MPPVVRLGDMSTGHSCWPAIANDEASTNVFANNLGVHRVGDTQLSHCCGPVCHVGTQITGSPNVFANNKAVARIGDNYSCGDHDAEGSPNVFANG
jgi:uncharacterized Zn-binding protein involved in type VI secretion